MGTNIAGLGKSKGGPTKCPAKGFTAPNGTKRHRTEHFYTVPKSAAGNNLIYRETNPVSQGHHKVKQALTRLYKVKQASKKNRLTSLVNKPFPRSQRGDEVDSASPHVKLSESPRLRYLCDLLFKI